MPDPTVSASLNRQSTAQTDEQLRISLPPKEAKSVSRRGPSLKKLAAIEGIVGGLQSRQLKANKCARPAVSQVATATVGAISGARKRKANRIQHQLVDPSLNNNTASGNCTTTNDGSDTPTSVQVMRTERLEDEITSRKRLSVVALATLMILQQISGDCRLSQIVRPRQRSPAVIDSCRSGHIRAQFDGGQLAHAAFVDKSV